MNLRDYVIEAERTGQDVAMACVRCADAVAYADTPAYRPAVIASWCGTVTTSDLMAAATRHEWQTHRPDAQPRRAESSLPRASTPAAENRGECARRLVENVTCSRPYGHWPATPHLGYNTSGRWFECVEVGDGQPVAVTSGTPWC